MPITNVQFPADEEGGIPSVSDYLIERLGEIDAFEVFEEIENEIIGHYYADLFRENVIENPRDDVLCIRLDSKKQEVRLFGYMRDNEIIVVHGMVKKRHTRTP